MVRSCPICAAARAKLFGTAIGSGFGCQAQVSRTRLRPAPSFSRTVSMSARAWQGWCIADSRLMTGTPENFAKAASTGSRRSSPQSFRAAKVRTPIPEQ